MNKQELLADLASKYELITVIDLDSANLIPEFNLKDWLRKQLESVYTSEYANNQRIVFTLSQGTDLLVQLQKRLNEIDISNFFVIVLVGDTMLIDYYNQSILPNSTDSVPCTVISYTPTPLTRVVEKAPATAMNKHAYNSAEPLKISLNDVTDRERFLLADSKRFCIYPWIHIHAYPTGAAYPCCMADMDYPLGDCRKNTLEEIWNQDAIKDVRRRMLDEQPVQACMRCYEQEAAGFMSGRQSANKHHGHHISRVAETQEDGTLERFELTYWDIRFSNLCNLKCRSCGHIFSSSWFQDQVALAGPEWGKNNKPLFYAGRFETDAYDQLIKHLDYVEQIYFAGGEPLMMEEHYLILEELERRGRFDVRLIYNTNFTQTKLKDRYVFDYWRKFDSVSVGASLDAMGSRAEYIRKGTNWDQVESNRRMMLEMCPNVDFYISPTLSIFNALHLPDFHRSWVEQGLIKVQDLNINILQDPPYYRIDIAPAEYKCKIQTKFEQHLDWIKGQDPLRRATVGFESAINFLNATDNTGFLERFWDKTNQIDRLRNENILDIIPELAKLNV